MWKTCELQKPRILGDGDTWGILEAVYRVLMGDSVRVGFGRLPTYFW